MKGRRSLQVDAGARPLAPPTPARAGGRLSEGTVVQVAIRARLLGIPLLRLDASAVLLPTAVTASPPLAVVAGEGLVEAARSLDDASAILAEVQGNGTG